MTIITRIYKHKNLWRWRVFDGEAVIPEGFGEAYTLSWAKFRAKCFVNKQNKLNNKVEVYRGTSI
jgi:hypothetical protein